ncbi:hypothetical protein FGO68_gene8248 [Halteria grandinella]|uniref:Transmembrane protein n=1 Tax=Halteria grandinella TaxID=5974 RepID=A0A8J8P8L8_HALGN|nr:hypothetical protein FGO68_gene8248 [Halteria grandinella]
MLSENCQSLIQYIQCCFGQWQTARDNIQTQIYYVFTRANIAKHSRKEMSHYNHTDSHNKTVLAFFLLLIGMQMNILVAYEASNIQSNKTMNHSLAKELKFECSINSRTNNTPKNSNQLTDQFQSNQE